MRTFCYVLFGFIVVASSCSNSTVPENSNLSKKQGVAGGLHITFVPHTKENDIYSYTEEPTFEVKGAEFTYVHPYPPLLPKPHFIDTVCSGVLRPSSIDSILQLVSSVQDTLVFCGGDNYFSEMDILTIRNDSDYVVFKLQNHNHPVAHQIISILNSNLPAETTPLALLERAYPRTCCIQSSWDDSSIEDIILSWKKSSNQNKRPD